MHLSQEQLLLLREKYKREEEERLAAAQTKKVPTRCKACLLMQFDSRDPGNSTCAPQKRLLTSSTLRFCNRWQLHVPAAPKKVLPIFKAEK